MARKLIQYVEVSDDLDGSPTEEDAIEFGLDGVIYTIDLTAEHGQVLRDFLQNYIDHAHQKRKIPRTQPTPKKKTETPTSISSSKADANRDRDARAKIREWGTRNGWDVKAQGIIPADCVLAYQVAKPRAYIPPQTLEYAQTSIKFREENDVQAAS